MSNSAPSHLDLFSGIGGFALAARWSGFQTVAFCEKEVFCQNVLTKHWPGVHCFEDITTLTPELIRGVYAGQIDVVTGGFPCQNLAACGDGTGLEGEKSKLWFEYLRIIQEVRPNWVVIENSPMLRLRGSDVVLQGLEDARYTPWASVVGACDAGAPHERKRVVIVAHTNDTGREEQRERKSVAAQQLPAECRCGGMGQAMGDLDKCGCEGQSRGGQTRSLRTDMHELGLTGGLNPDWCEVFMGYPADWTNINGPRTPSKINLPGNHHERDIAARTGLAE